MARFQTKKIPFRVNLEGLAIGDVGVFYGHLVNFAVLWCICGHFEYFVVIWYTFPRFGMFYHEKSGNPVGDPIQQRLD
jgi:hypothetical protein